MVSRAADLLLVGGVGLLTYGAWEIYPPAAAVVAGALFLAGGALLGRKVKG